MCVAVRLSRVCARARVCACVCARVCGPAEGEEAGVDAVGGHALVDDARVHLKQNKGTLA